MILIPPFRHCVYLIMRRDHVVIYVGVTSNLFARLGQHALKAWWSEAAFIEIESFETRAAAERRETDLIKLIAPFYNVSGNGQGEVRHLEEMRLAVTAIRDARKRAAIKVPNIPLAVIEIPCAPPSPDGVSLAEAAPVLKTGLANLRRRSTQPGFPPSIGTRGSGRTATKLYDLEALRSWRSATQSDQ